MKKNIFNITGLIITVALMVCGIVGIIASAEDNTLKIENANVAYNDMMHLTFTLVAGAALLREDGLKVRIVSCPSEGLFRTQPKEYQKAVLPCGEKIFGLTAGLPVNLEGLVGSNGKVFGLESFGFSAPYPHC